jgi:hypothetical protein
MAFTEQVRIVIDFVTKRSGDSLSTIKSDVAQAEGAFGKLKAGIGGVGGALKSIGPQAYAAAGIAVAGFAANAARRFEELATSAGKFSDATGLAVEDASRWMEVAGDIGIETSTVESAFARLAATLGKSPDALGKYGVAVDRAKDGSVNLQGTILNVIGALNGMKPEQRAAAMREIFGKGAIGAAELFNMSVEDVAKSLKEVSGAKVINPAEEAKAKRLRAATDDLAGSWEDFTLSLGGAVAGLADAVGILADVANGVGKVNDALSDATGGGVDLFTGALGSIKAVWDDVTGSGEDFTDETRDATKATGDLGDEADTTAARVAAIGAAFDHSVQAINAALGELDVEEAVADVAPQLDKLQEAAVEAWGAAAAGGEEAEAAQRGYQEEIRNTKRTLLEALAAIKGLPPEVVTSIVADIDEGSFDRAAQRLEILARNRTMEISIITKGGAGYGTGGSGPRSVPRSMAFGTAPPSGAGLAAVPMAVTAGQPIINNVTMNLPPGSDSDSRVVGAIQRWSRRNGNIPIPR